MKSYQQTQDETLCFDSSGTLAESEVELECRVKLRMLLQLERNYEIQSFESLGMIDPLEVGSGEQAKKELFQLDFKQDIAPYKAEKRYPKCIFIPS